MARNGSEGETCDEDKQDKNMIMVRWRRNMMVRMMVKDKGEKKGKQIKFLVQHLRKSQRGLV